MKPNGDRTVQGRGNQLSRKMSKSGQDDFVTLGAAALLTGLLIFVAGREQKHDESSKDCDLDALQPLTHGSRPMSQLRSKKHARLSPDAAGPRGGRARSHGEAGRTFSGGPGRELRTITFSRLPEVSHFLPSLRWFPPSRLAYRLTHCSPMHAQFRASLICSPISYLLQPSTLCGTKSSASSRAAMAGLRLSFLGSLALSLWSANSGVKALFEALNILYGEEEKRSIVQLSVFSMLLTICSIAAMLMIVTGVVVLPLVFSITGFLGIKLTIIALLRWPAMLILAMVAFEVFYRYGPSRRLVQAHWITLGSLMAAFLLARDVSDIFLVSQSCRKLHSNIRCTRRSHWLDDVDVAFRTVIVLVGAKLNAEIEHQTAEDTTIGPPKPLGSRGAVMADTVGRAVV